MGSASSVSYTHLDVYKRQLETLTLPPIDMNEWLSKLDVTITTEQFQRFNTAISDGFLQYLSLIHI